MYSSKAFKLVTLGVEFILMQRKYMNYCVVYLSIVYKLFNVQTCDSFFCEYVLCFRRLSVIYTETRNNDWLCLVFRR